MAILTGCGRSGPTMGTDSGLMVSTITRGWRARMSVRQACASGSRRLAASCRSIRARPDRKWRSDCRWRCMSDARIRLGLVGDHPIILRGRQRLFEHEADLEVVRTCTKINEAV